MNRLLTSILSKIKSYQNPFVFDGTQMDFDAFLNYKDLKQGLADRLNLIGIKYSI